jgi:hypothetical protein
MLGRQGCVLNWAPSPYKVPFPKAIHIAVRGPTSVAKLADAVWNGISDIHTG